MTRDEWKAAMTSVLDSIDASVKQARALVDVLPEEAPPAEPVEPPPVIIVPPEPEQPPAPDPSPSPGPVYFGCPFTATSLGDIHVGADVKRHVFLPFISPYDGNAETLTFYGVWAESGYGAGTGGTIEITLVDGESGKPGAKVAGGHIVHKDPKAQYGGRGKSSLKGTFSSPVGPLERGKLYFVHFDNIASNDVDNFIGVDVLNHNAGYVYGSKFMPANLLVCTYRSDTGDFKTHAQRVNNCLDIGYSNGKHFSWPYMEVWLPGSNHWNAKVTATQWSRQRITPINDMTLTELTVAAKHISGTGALIVEIRAGGSLLKAVRIPSGAFATDKQAFCNPVPISPSLLVKGGVEHFVSLRAESGEYTCYPLRCGGKSGGDYTKTVDGYCEWSTNSGGSWSGGWYGWSSDKRLKIADLPICAR